MDNCIECSVDITNRRSNAKYCLECAEAIERRNWARRGRIRRERLRNENPVIEDDIWQVYNQLTRRHHG